MNILKILQMKGKEPIAVVTAYDYFSAKVCECAGIDMILVGDSLGNVVLGYQSTLNVEMEDMERHIMAVRRGAPNSFIIGDMPFMSYQISDEEGIKNAGKLMKAGANAVKVEGGERVSSLVRKLVDAGIPVMGHIGLTPQSVNQIGGYRVQGKGPDKERMMRSAKSLENAGVFSIVLELTVEETAKLITESLSIPTIGIGAGRYCDGQVLVWHDLLGINDGKVPKFVKKYANLNEIIESALKTYIQDVKGKTFPDERNIFKEDE
ncbi:3-methyl-2-oxobutanoate hydroxymethyltransferase [Athalassotoga sp.]|uniref:3-methyl-2-oxobutanoate hydroxymethyltransferase n=1 Tax=Athalassotoga sp. TaxID=2022597 RepID=UPI003D043EA6